ncbi:MAG: sugar ABC transporter permease, partial [Clostridia bacterium]|nr:sugar ABC transporter permease [Clostridia bacterium]
MKRKGSTVLRPNGGKLMARRNNTGWIFVAPFLIGFLLFYGIPLVESFIFSFNDIKIHGSSYTLESKGWENYRYVLFVDTKYLNRLIDSVKNMFLDTIIVVPFSFFSALILSREFKGRGLARAIFFLPVVMSTGVLATMDKNQLMNMMMARSATAAANSMSSAFSSSDFVNTLLQGSMPESIITFMTNLSSKLYDVIIKSGLQIIIF